MKLDKDIAIAAALSLLNEVGLEGLTMRALAKALDVQAPSLYYHFPSKQSLLEDMANAMIGTVASQPIAETSWDTALRELARCFRAALLRYRDGGKVFAGTYALRPNVLMLSEIALRTLLSAGLDEAKATHCTFNLIYYMLGLVIEEQAFGEQWSEPDVPHVRQDFKFAAKPFPSLSRCLDQLFASNFDERFEIGLDTHIDGIACFLSQTAGYDSGAPA